MNRRDFMKFFGVTAAATATAGALAKIPEAEPRIALIEPRSPVTFDGPPRLITSITELTVSEDGNYNGYLPGQRIKTVSARYYANSAERGRWVVGQRIQDSSFPFVDQVVSFDVAQLAGERYVVTDYMIESSIDSVVLASVNAIRIG